MQHRQTAWYTICQNRVSLHFFKKHLTQQSKYVPIQHSASCSHATVALAQELDSPSQRVMDQINKHAHSYCPHSTSIATPCILHTSWVLHRTLSYFPCAYFSPVLSVQYHTARLYSTTSCLANWQGPAPNTACVLWPHYSPLGSLTPYCENTLFLCYNFNGYKNNSESWWGKDINPVLHI